MVFYNGDREVADEVFLKLSDSFSEEHKSEADIEVKVRMLNINHGRNTKLMEACQPLREYSWFIGEIGRNLNNQDKRDIVAAVRDAIKAIPAEFVIRDFLLAHRAEVEGMLDTEYNEAEVKELFKEEGRIEGLDEGIIGAIVILRGLGLDDAAITEKIMTQCKLTLDEAKKYL